MITLARKFHPLRKERRATYSPDSGFRSVRVFGFGEENEDGGLGCEFGLGFVLFSLECGEKHQL